MVLHITDSRFSHGVTVSCSPVESELDLDLGYIENVLMDFDS